MSSSVDIHNSFCGYLKSVRDFCPATPSVLFMVIPVFRYYQVLGFYQVFVTVRFPVSGSGKRVRGPGPEELRQRAWNLGLSSLCYTGITGCFSSGVLSFWFPGPV
jgi:hypothetical protein